MKVEKQGKMYQQMDAVICTEKYTSCLYVSSHAHYIYQQRVRFISHLQPPCRISGVQTGKGNRNWTRYQKSVDRHASPGI